MAWYGLLYIAAKAMNFTYYNHGDRSERKVALTFDDGPNPYATEMILDILKQHSVPAAFFVLGKRVKQRPWLVKRMIEEKHIIGNHTYSHSRKKRDYGKAEIFIKSVTGKGSCFVRPPYMKLDFTDDELRQVEERKIICCDFNSHDYEPSIQAEEIYRYVIAEAQNGSIIVFHDGSERDAQLNMRPRQTIKALPWIIEALQPKYKFVSLDQLNLVGKRKSLYAGTRSAAA